MSAYASRPAAFPIPMRRRLRACFRLHGRGCPDMRRWAKSACSAQELRGGRGGSPSASEFGGRVARTASRAGAWPWSNLPTSSRRGGKMVAAAVLVTAPGGQAAAERMDGSRPRGGIPAAGATPHRVEDSTTDLLFGNRAIGGAITGTPAPGDGALRFSGLTGVAAMIETMPL